jgi:ribosomal protein S18 acetylase RimI-like enzyme
MTVAAPDWLAPPMLVERGYAVSKVLAVPDEALEAMRALYLLLDQDLPPLTREQVDRAVAWPGVTILASMVGEELAGVVTFVSAPTLGRNRAWAEDLVVAREYRRMGIGTGLMEACASLAVDAGAGELTGTVNPEREAAVGLYRDLGWKVGPSLAAKLYTGRTE